MFNNKYIWLSMLFGLSLGMSTQGYAVECVGDRCIPEANLKPGDSCYGPGNLIATLTCQGGTEDIPLCDHGDEKNLAQYKCVEIPATSESKHALPILSRPSVPPPPKFIVDVDSDDDDDDYLKSDRERLAFVEQRTKVISSLLSESCAQSASSGDSPRTLARLSRDIHRVAAKLLPPHYKSSILMTDDKFKETINNVKGYKLEIGADLLPLIAGERCIFIDKTDDLLSHTKTAFGSQEGKHPPVYVKGTASDLSGIENRPIDRIVSRNFPWEHTSTSDIKSILTEYKKVLSDGGKIIITHSSSQNVNGISVWLRDVKKIAATLHFRIEDIISPNDDGIILSNKPLTSE